MEEPAAAEAGVVHQYLDGQAELFDPAPEALARGRIAEVAGERLRADAVAGPQLLGQLVEPLGAAPPGPSGVTAAGERASDVGADAGRGAGDEAGRAG